MTALSEKQSLAIAAAHQATEAAAELLRFAREGEGLPGPFETEVVEKLADALRMTIQIEGRAATDDELARVDAALEQLLEGWA